LLAPTLVYTGRRVRGGAVRLPHHVFEGHPTDFVWYCSEMMVALNLSMTMMEASKDDFGHAPCLSLALLAQRPGPFRSIIPPSAVHAKADAHVQLRCRLIRHKPQSRPPPAVRDNTDTHVQLRQLEHHAIIAAAACCPRQRSYSPHDTHRCTHPSGRHDLTPSACREIGNTPPGIATGANQSLPREENRSPVSPRAMATGDIE
jgi:hypothetical protein